MNVQTKTAPVSDVGDNGFHVLLSTPDTDRDGEQLHLGQWKTPLPAHVPFSADHDMSTNGVVGSGEPSLTAAGLEVRGTWAVTDRARHVRELVKSGHIRHVSVEFLRHRDESTGSVKHELLGGSFVYVPANPGAKVLSSKAGARNSAQDQRMLQAIHDASVLLGADCVTEHAPDVDDGSSESANKEATGGARGQGAAIAAETGGLSVAAHRGRGHLPVPVGTPSNRDTVLVSRLRATPFQVVQRACAVR